MANFLPLIASSGDFGDKTRLVLLNLSQACVEVHVLGLDEGSTFHYLPPRIHDKEEDDGKISCEEVLKAPIAVDEDPISVGEQNDAHSEESNIIRLWGEAALER